ncbi:MAG: IPT/TIG domain-containing protein [Methylococcaceae bacterium]|nr:IPT/TIG domain-containing protein [Methylococcaceae bacterium]MCI0732431.1 IPT/TIG domain-containing protein [Methylococcaceae bacterium]
MIQSTIKVLLVLAGFLPVDYAAALAAGKPATQPPVIVSTAFDADQNGMVISGHHFGSAVPIVRLGNQVLQVKSHTDNQAVVTLPPAIPSATYRLTVTTDGPRKLTSAPFSATVFSVADR